MEHWIGIERNKSLDFSRLLFCFEYHNHLPFREIEKDMRLDQYCCIDPANLDGWLFFVAHRFSQTGDG